MDELLLPITSAHDVAILVSADSPCHNPRGEFFTGENRHQADPQWDHAARETQTRGYMELGGIEAGPPVFQAVEWSQGDSSYLRHGLSSFRHRA